MCNWYTLAIGSMSLGLEIDMCSCPLESLVREIVMLLALIRSHVMNLRCILLVFEAALGLRINLCKSKLIRVGSILHLHLLTNLLGCQVESLPTSYLGLPLGAKFRSYAAWNPIVERVERRLDLWKSKLLSKGGKMALLKSVLSSLPIYFMSLLVICKTVCLCLEKAMRRFLWGSAEGDAKIHLINWNRVCSDVT